MLPPYPAGVAGIGRPTSLCTRWLPSPLARRKAAGSSQWQSVQLQVVLSAPGCCFPLSGGMGLAVWEAGGNPCGSAFAYGGDPTRCPQVGGVACIGVVTYTPSVRETRRACCE